jgi:hypothetical protein
VKIPAFRTDDGKKSYTMTALVVGFAIINIKLLFSGIEVTDKIKMSDFSGTDYGAALAGLGVIYNWGKSQKKEEEKQ